MEVKKMMVQVCVFVVAGYVNSQIVTQPDLDTIAAGLEIKVDVVENLDDGSRHLFKVTFNNNASKSLSGLNWKIYFFSFFIVESKHILSEDGLYTKPEGYILPNVNLKLRHENGCLFSMSPTTGFIGLPYNGEREITFYAANWAVSKTDIPPNWYITADGLNARVIDSTKEGFVGEFTSAKQWKRKKADRYDPYSPMARYQRYKTTNPNVQMKMIIPTPKEITNHDTTKLLDISGQVTIVHNGLDNEASFLKDKYSFNISTTASPNGVNIYLSINNTILSAEGYTLTVNPSEKSVIINGKTNAGVLYGVQSLLSLLSHGRSIPQMEIRDEPRFEFRGMFIDVARNFIPKKVLEKLMDAMAMYKLNKLHLHLADDEGWRIEIDGLPELTEVGSKRCHTEIEDVCLIPQLGSGPYNTTSGSGFYSIQDYKDILSYAKKRHIEVIPEVDMPGHARAAIIAMEARYRKYSNTNNNEAEKYRLIDPDNESKFLSVQIFNDNAVNPCIESTYDFIEKIVSELKVMHSAVGHPLDIYHFGGDEVAKTAWVNSTKCNQLNFNFSGDAESIRNELKNYFTQRVANITFNHGLNTAGWEDGFNAGDGMPFDRKLYQNQRVYSNAWDNVWEWGEARRAYNYANAGYKVIMSHATHLYFDHPYEPDPEERGLYWAPRFTDSYKSFRFLPDNLYENIDVTRMGDPLSKSDVCGVNDKKCPSLQEPENIAGMQGHLWSETILSEDNFYYMVFPRLLALAERAWYKAPWETVGDKTKRNRDMNNDWDNFAETLGKKELNRLDSMGIKYRIPPPGGSLEGDEIKFNTAFPGLSVEFSTNSQTWNNGTILYTGSPVFLRTKSADGSRTSRVVQFKTVTSTAQTIQLSITTIMFCSSLLYICLLRH
ncbi:beta-hexosaminidase-like isoform X2 [Mytilus californianus]|uniref:beta-hexosaminidase-like isoform X2 n=1 Tax=Mytilus californianus TaxID=6549 RepID=UPI0022459BA3|nr:beta-hexosaminidase-like isoform X2 [Mytilus californianus]